MHIVHDYVEAYMNRLWPAESEDLSKMRDYANEHHVPIIEREIVEFINFLLSMTEPKNILELGTAIGYSSIVMAKASKNSLVDTVELDGNIAELARKNVLQAQLDDRITIYVDDALSYLKTSKKYYDFIFIDAAKGQYKKYLREALNHLTEDGFILCDDVLFQGMVANDTLVKRRKKTIVKRMRELLAEIVNDPKLVTTLIPMADGLLLIRRR